jgi:hypothetical protein
MKAKEILADLRSYQVRGLISRSTSREFMVMLAGIDWRLGDRILDSHILPLEKIPN